MQKIGTSSNITDGDEWLYVDTKDHSLHVQPRNSTNVLNPPSTSRYLYVGYKMEVVAGYPDRIARLYGSATTVPKGLYKYVPDGDYCFMHPTYNSKHQWYYDRALTNPVSSYAYDYMFYVDYSYYGGLHVLSGNYTETNFSVQNPESGVYGYYFELDPQTEQRPIYCDIGYFGYHRGYDDTPLTYKTIQKTQV